MGKARGVRGRGTVFQRADGLWIGAISYVEAGKRKRLRVSGATAEIADQKLSELKLKVARGETRSESGTVSELLDEWLERSIKPRRKAATAADHENTIEKHLKPGLGRLQVAKLTPRKVEQFYALLREKNVGSRTIQKAHVVLGAAIRYAVRQGRAFRSPLEGVEAPVYRARRYEPWTAEEAAQFIEAVKGDPLEPLYLLAIYTGMRQGELFGLQRQDVDLKARSIFVQYSLSNVKGKRAIGDPKREGSRRRITLPDPCVDALRKHLKALAASGDATGFVFPGRDGQGLSRHTFRTQCWEALLERAWLRPIRFHDLRHTCATLLLKNGEHPLVVSKLLGHATIAITMDTYSHVLPTLQEGAMDRMSTLLDEAKGCRTRVQSERPARRKP